MLVKFDCVTQNRWYSVSLSDKTQKRKLQTKASRSGFGKWNNRQKWCKRKNQSKDQHYLSLSIPQPTNNWYHMSFYDYNFFIKLFSQDKIPVHVWGKKIPLHSTDDAFMSE